MGIYRDLKEALEKELSRLAGLPELKGPNLARLIDKLRENRFNLVVLGAFKRGKSTLINALLGEPMLPTAIVPLTSVVTVLGYGEQLKYRGPVSQWGAAENLPAGIGGLYHRERQSAQSEGGKGSGYHLSLRLFEGWGAGHRHPRGGLGL